MKVPSPAGTSLGHELNDPLNLLKAKIATVGLPACRTTRLLVGGKGAGRSRPQSICMQAGVHSAAKCCARALCQTLRLLPLPLNQGQIFCGAWMTCCWGRRCHMGMGSSGKALNQVHTGPARVKLEPAPNPPGTAGDLLAKGQTPCWTVRPAALPLVPASSFDHSALPRPTLSPVVGSGCFHALVCGLLPSFIHYQALTEHLLCSRGRGVTANKLFSQPQGAESGR